MTSAAVADLVNTIGLTATLKLVQRWGGRSLWVPYEIPGHHAIAVTIGAEAAAALAAAYGGTEIDMPAETTALREARNREIVRQFQDERMSISAIAAAASLSRVTINRVLDEHGIDRRNRD